MVQCPPANRCKVTVCYVAIVRLPCGEEQHHVRCNDKATLIDEAAQLAAWQAHVTEQCFASCVLLHQPVTHACVCQGVAQGTHIHIDKPKICTTIPQWFPSPLAHVTIGPLMDAAEELGATTAAHIADLRR